MLRNIFGVVDGGRLLRANYVDAGKQKVYYEGFAQRVEVASFLVFDFKGEVLHVAINFPGSRHDSKLVSSSGLRYPKLGAS